MPGYAMIADSAIYGKEWFLLSEGIMHNAPTGQSPVTLGCIPYAVSTELQRCFIQHPSLKQQLLGALTLYVDVQNTMASITFALWVTLMVGAGQKGVANLLTADCNFCGHP